MNNKQDTLLGIVLVLVSLIQLAEYVLWMNQSCNTYNYFATLSIPVILYLQPILCFIAYFKLFPTTKYPSLISKTVFNTLWAIFTAALLGLLYMLSGTKLCSKPSSVSDRLSWGIYANLTFQKAIIVGICLFLYAVLWMLLFMNLVNLGYVQQYPIRYLLLISIFPMVALYIGYTQLLHYYLSGTINLPRMIEIAGGAIGSVSCFLAVFSGIVGMLHI